MIERVVVAAAEDGGAPGNVGRVREVGVPVMIERVVVAAAEDGGRAGQRRACERGGSSSDD
jgi:hypothetical protein